MKKDIINFKQDYFRILILASFAFLIGFSYPYLQYGVDGGLVLSGLIKYPDLNSPMIYYYLNSWTSIHQISSILLQIGLSVEILSKFLMIVVSVFFSFGVFLISFSLTQKRNLSLFIAVTSIILGKNFGDTDYPSLIFSEHTYGMLSLATFTLILGLIANKNVFIASVVTMILISIHPVIGVWTLILIAISFYYSKIYIIYGKDIYRGVLIGFFLIITSFLFYYFNTIEKLAYDNNLFLNYLNNWDGHRIISKTIHYEYLAKTLLLSFFCILGLKKNFNSSSYSPHLLIILLSSVFSTILYLLYKFYPFIFPEFFKIIMPSRFIMLHTFLGWPVIICIVIFLTKNLFRGKIIILISAILVLILVQNYNRIFLIKDNIKNDLKIKEESNVLNFLKTENIKTNLIVPSSLVSYVFKKTKKPILLHTESLDFIPYHPYLIDKFFRILEIVYDIKDNLPPEKNNPYLNDKYIKGIFEKRSKEEWLLIKKEFNVEFILVPDTWNLKLDKSKEDKNYKLYQL